MTIPSSNVWIHEKSIHKLVKAPGGDRFVPYHSLTITMRGIKRGYCGSEKGGCTETNYTVAYFASEGSDYRLSFQRYGNAEVFFYGKLAKKNGSNHPRWFNAGVALCDIKPQLLIVDALLGEAPGL